MNFSKRFSNFSCEKMTLYNNNDQTWFSDTLTSARPLSGSSFNSTLGVQQVLMHRKKHMFDPYSETWTRLPAKARSYIDLALNFSTTALNQENILSLSLSRLEFVNVSNMS